MKMFCLACESSWLSEWTARCWSCGREGSEGRLPDGKVPASETSAVTHYASLPDADEPDYWSPW